MKILNGKSRASRMQSLAGASLVFLSVCVSMPVIAAPDSPDANSKDQAAGSVFEYLNIAGSAFHPSITSTTYTYAGAGCISRTGGGSTSADQLFTHKAILPDGAVVKFLRLYYYDSSVENISAFLTTYDGAGNFNQRTSASSTTGSTGFGTELSPEINFTVDRYTNAINIVANLGNQNDNTLRFCGVRVAYHAPITDRIFADGFELIQL